MNPARVELMRRANGLTVIVSDEQLQKEQEAREHQEEGYVPLPEPQNTGCYACNATPKRIDSYGRLWCIQHAPQGCHLYHASSFLEGVPLRAAVDLRYRRCAWYSTKRPEPVACQALDYALNGDWYYLDLQWYTPYLLTMFRDNPEEAIAWIELVHKAYKAKDKYMLQGLASQIFAQDVLFFVEPDTCYKCFHEATSKDVHGRAWCSEHAPEA